MLTESSAGAYRVQSGTILVYIVPVSNGSPGRRIRIYEASEGEVIPGFFCEDRDRGQWAFCLTALEQAQVMYIPDGGSRLLKERFAAKANLLNYKTEGYEGSIIDQYGINLVKEDSFILRSQKQRAEDAASTDQLIREAFEKETAPSSGTDNLLYDALAVICRQMHVRLISYKKLTEYAGEEFTVSDVSRLSRFACREVVLDHNWYHQDAGPLLVYDLQGMPMACLPKGTGSYILYDPRTGKKEPMTDRRAAEIFRRAVMIYRPLPEHSLTRSDLIRFCLQTVRIPDVILLVFLTLVTAAIGLLLPYLNQQIYDSYIPLGASSVIFQAGSLLASFMIANLLFSVVKNLVHLRLVSRMSIELQAAVYHRVFNLPESFFRGYESADLANRIMKAGSIVSSIANTVILSAISLVYLIVYFCRMAGYSGRLAFLGLLMAVIFYGIYYFIAVQAVRYKQKSVALEGESDSKMYQFINGIAKVRTAGAENRVLYEYFKPYTALRDCEEQKNRRIHLKNVLSLISGSVFSIIMYILVMHAGGAVSLGGFLAFLSLFGSFTACFQQIAEGLASIKNEQPDIERLTPVLQTAPELREDGILPGEITGAITIKHVTFAYDPGGPTVLKDLSVSIRPGEYVGIAGPSGCGKSTLLKLLLGFETPDSGSVFYDDKDLSSLDKRELRKKMGVVLQDGKLISGSIFDNITITAPYATLDDVWKVVREVGLEPDIQAMPMGLNTVLSEDSGIISGGQQQRILIARALISDPKIILFDEATSALDNITQRIVSDKLETMPVTRIVIAHRLSTVIGCDRILVMNEGRIEEQGTYEELLQKKGLFYDLARRQIE